MPRSQLGRSVVALSLALVALLGVVAVLAWLTLRGGGRPGFERADNPRVEVPQSSGATISAESSPLEARSAEKGEPGASAPASATAATNGTGTLRIHVLDEKTRAPIAGLAFVAYRERGGVKELARGTTDDQGRAELPAIEANTVIVRTERRPPYAETAGAVWLTPGATKELELLVGEGSAITGRVIDDLQHPVEGAEIRIAFEPESAPPAGRSGPDGRFRLEHLASRPASIWIVDGEMRPERWDELWIYAVRDNTSTISAGTEVTPVPGKDVDVGDLVLARAAIFAGHVIDAGGRAVAGAVLSFRNEIARGPADPEFQRLPGDTLTDARGAFEVRAEPRGARVGVGTREGLVQYLRLPQGKPGERLDGVELKLDPELRFELELLDASGATANIPAPQKTQESMGGNWQSFRNDSTEKVSVVARSTDGARSRAVADHADPDGKWRLRLPIDPRTTGEIRVIALGYAPFVERSERGFPEFVQRRITLEACPTFHVRLVRKETSQLLAEPGEDVRLSICMADPERHAAAHGHCCGLGAFWQGRWRGEPLDLALAVRKQAPFWIYALHPAPSAGFEDCAHVGPFEPGLEVRELVLDPADFVTRKADSAPRKPPEPSQPGEKHDAHLRAHIGNARTGKPIPGAWIHMSEIGAGNGSSAGTNENGDIADAAVPAGRFALRLAVRGYKTLELGEHTTREGETLDLGTLLLEPLPSHRGRIVDADGSALGRVWLGVVAGGLPVQEQNGGMGTEADGSFQLIGELPSSFVLQVMVPAMHAGWGARAQRLVLEPWPEDEVKELRLAPCRRIVLTVAGVDPDEAELVPYACPAPGDPTSSCDHRVAPVPRHEPLVRGLGIASSQAGPRYAFLLAPGRYQFYGSNILHELVWTQFEVTPGATDLELAIPAH